MGSGVAATGAKGVYTTAAGGLFANSVIQFCLGRGQQVQAVWFWTQQQNNAVVVTNPATIKRDNKYMWLNETQQMLLFEAPYPQ